MIWKILSVPLAGQGRFETSIWQDQKRVCTGVAAEFAPLLQKSPQLLRHIRNALKEMETTPSLRVSNHTYATLKNLVKGL
jgi:hypothetical protein